MTSQPGFRLSGTRNIAIAMSASNTHNSPSVALPPREEAWLTYQALDQSDDIVLLLESEAGAEASGAVIIGANGAFRRASGYAAEQLLGRQVGMVFAAANQTEALMNAIRTHGTLHTELTCGRADGGTFLLGMHLMPAAERTQGRFCSVILGRDITELQKVRQMQNSTQRLLAKVFMSVDNAVTIVNGAGRVVMTNPRADRLMGYKENALIGKSSIDLVAPDARASVEDAIRQQFEHGADLTYVAPLLHADGSRIDTTITSVVVETEDKKRFRILTLRSEAPGAAAMRTETAGRIKLVGLDDVRLALGDRWPAVAERAMATAEAVVKRRCGKQDSYSRADDTSFLICFGALNERESAFRASMIGREIRDRLIGQGGDPDTAFVRSIAAAVRFPDLGKSGASLNVVLLDGLDKQMERIEQEARNTLRDALASATCALQQVSGRNRGDTVATEVLLPNKLSRELTTALGALPEKESRAFDQDGLLLGLAAQHAIGAMGRGEATPVILKVRFDVFATRPATERYLATCLKIDARVSSRLILLLSSLPQGLPKTRLLECVNRLRPFCAGVGYQVSDVAGLALIDLSLSASPIVSLPASVLSLNEPDKVRSLIGSLRARRAKVLVRRVASEEDAAAFRLLGADLISMERAGS
jgi:PAS domain S-box-containing protein